MSEFTCSISPTEGAPEGFSFDNVHRNAQIQGQLLSNNSNNNATRSASGNSSSASVLPLATKTGTTIVGVVYKDGVVLGADTRSTNDTTVADKNCEKIHYIAPNIYCCGAGTAADTEKTTELISSQMELLRMNTGGGQSRVVTACTLLKRMLFRYQGYVSAALVLGGGGPPRPTPVPDLPPRLHGKAPVHDHGVRVPRGHGRLRGRLPRRHDGGRGRQARAEGDPGRDIQRPRERLERRHLRDTVGRVGQDGTERHH
ncbi:hypothetical protein THAOC_03103, partial [Thalassiosira oceanica]